MSSTAVPRTVKAAVFVAVASMACALSPAPASAATCVKVGTKCYKTIQAAVDAAPAGATVTVPAGRFAGGIVITKNLTLQGAGAKRTIIAGGEHVITVGEYLAKKVPTVTIAKVTLTGGIARSLVGEPDGITAGGGGLIIVPAEWTDDASYTGPIVTVTDSVISGNRAAPSAQLLPKPEQEEFWPRCPDGFCPYAGAQGGGIVNSGTLTLIRSKVKDNSVGGALTSDAVGGGIYNVRSLTIKDSAISGNRAQGSAPYGRYAEGGGVFSGSGGGVATLTVTLRNTSVTNNVASLDAVWPVYAPDGSWIDTSANGGGVHAGNDSKVSVISSYIDRNRVSYRNPNGAWGAIDSGLLIGVSDLTMRNSTVSGNRLFAHVKSTADGGPMGGAIEWGGTATISGSRFERNVSEVVASKGDAGVAAAVASLSILATGSTDFKTLITDSRISHNKAIARTKTGAATVVGAGLLNQSPLTMRGVKIRHNTGITQGRSGSALGGGIAHGPLLPQDPGNPAGSLLLKSSSITRNTLKGAKAKRQGSGIYATDPMSVVRTRVKGNRPAPQCVGCRGASGARVAGLSSGEGSGGNVRGGDHKPPTSSPYASLPGGRTTR